MTQRLFLALDHHAAFRCGGWAFVLENGGQRGGSAGGERSVSTERAALLGLAASLGATAPGAVSLITGSSFVAELCAKLGEPAPDGVMSADQPLWEQVRKAAEGRALGVAVQRTEPRTPLAFAAAWAELARDKAKMTGTFQAAIPKTNLAKVLGL